MICIILLYKEIYGFCFGNAKGMWIKLLVEQVGDESRNPLSSSEIEIGYGILPLLSKFIMRLSIMSAVIRNSCHISISLVSSVK